MAVALASGEASRFTFSPVTFGALIHLIMFGSIGGFSAYAYALKHLPVATALLYAGAMVLVGMALVRE